MEIQNSALVPVHSTNHELVTTGSSTLIHINNQHILARYLDSENSSGFFINSYPYTKRSDLEWDIGRVLSKEKMTHPLYGKDYVVASSNLEFSDKKKQVHTILMISELKTQFTNIRTSLINDLNLQNIAELNLVKVQCTRELIHAFADHTLNMSLQAKQDEGTAFKSICKEIMELHPACSDIHFEISAIPGETRIRIRVDGELQTFGEYNYEYLFETVEVAYNVIGGDTDSGSSIEGNNLNWNEPRTAKFVYNEDNHTIEYRVEFLPRTTEKGGDLICRITAGLTGAKIRPIDETGYHPEQTKLIKRKSAEAQGNVMLAGVTGSGKSQTMYSIYDYLQDMSQGTRKFIVVENPVEMSLKGITQINLEDNTTAHNNESNSLEKKFKRVLEGNLRADPDVMGAGEIRCKNSATFSMEASKTGHLCISTIHASGVFEVPGRIDSWGIPRTVYLNSSSLSLVIAQSLVRTVCPYCSKKYHEMPPDSAQVYSLVEKLAELELLEYLKDIRFALKGGCEHCDHSVDGRKGRTPVAEVLAPDAKIRSLWVQSKDNEANAYWYMNGGFTKLEHAIYKMCQGELDPVIIEDAVGDLRTSKTKRDELSVPLYHPRGSK